MPHTNGHICWNELNCRDVAKARAFYAATLGWTYDEMPDTATGTPYTLCKAGDQVVAGMLDISAIPLPPEVPNHWFTYIAVDDLDAALKAAVAEGGSIQRQPFDVPDVGRISIVVDSVGSVLGIMTPV